MDGTTGTRYRRDDWRARGAHYEYRVLTIGGTTSRSEARRLLTDEA